MKRFEFRVISWRLKPKSSTQHIGACREPEGPCMQFSTLNPIQPHSDTAGGSFHKPTQPQYAKLHYPNPTLTTLTEPMTATSGGASRDAASPVRVEPRTLVHGHNKLSQGRAKIRSRMERQQRGVAIRSDSQHKTGVSVQGLGMKDALLYHATLYLNVR